MGRILLHSRIEQSVIEREKLTLVYSSHDYIRDCDIFIYEGESLPPWSKGTYPQEYNNWTDYMQHIHGLNTNATK